MCFYLFAWPGVYQSCSKIDFLCGVIYSYGTVSPPASDGCAGLRWFLALEAFFGVMYSGFCGAVFYSKVSRLNARASLTFSSAVCLQFGGGITKERLVVSCSDEQSSSSPLSASALDSADIQAGSDIQPYPVLDFRAVNDVSVHNVLCFKHRMSQL